jgi:RimJ/RimL family protein N-acetyltransferase
VSDAWDVVPITSIAPADAERLRRFHKRLSEDTVYLRYHGAHPRLADDEVGFFTGVDGHHHIARVARDADGELLGVCRFIEMPGDARTGEVAIVVADAAQGHGCGHELLRQVLIDARREGFDRAEADILAGNLRARGLFASVAAELGIPVTARRRGGEIVLDLNLAASA